MKNKDTIELLNSEGMILMAIKTTMTEHTGNGIKSQPGFKIKDRLNKTVGLLTEKQIFDFTRGKITIADSTGKVWDYSKEPGSMKPDLKTLDEFIGVDTTGKTY